MLDIDGKNMCESCFGEIDANLELCPLCGYNKSESGSITGCLSTDTILIGKYIIGKVLGKGGFGITYLAYDINRKIKVAIKEYMPDSLAYRAPGTSLISTYQGEKEEAFKAGAEKFYDEAKTIARFNGDPNIINVQEFFYENNTAYFVMEYIEGIDLKKYTAQKGGKLVEEEVIKISLPLMDALIVVHSVGVLHRDISPDNIYIANDGTIKLLDFGAARQVLGEQSKSLSVVLKPGFAPIEQYQTRGKQGPWTDVYSLAATIYYCLTGQIPDASMDRMEEDSLQSLSQQGVKVSPEFESAILKALSLRAVNRFQSIVDFKNAINSVSEEPIIVTEDKKEESVQSSPEINKTVALSKFNKNEILTYIKKHRIESIAAALAIILLSGIGVYAFSGNKNADSQLNGEGNNNGDKSTYTSQSSISVNESVNSSSEQISSSINNSSEQISSSINNSSVQITSGVPIIITVTVPNVVGKTSDQAITAMTSVGLNSTQTQQFSDTVTNGVVISQGNAAGTAITKGSTVSMVVSKGASTWSSWVDSLPAGVDSTNYIIQQKTQYQYRDKELTTNAASSLAGWTKYNETFAWSEWSGWGTSYVGATGTREVNTRAIAATYRTVHHYNVWKYWNTAAGAYYYSYVSGWGGYTGTWYYLDLDYALPLNQKATDENPGHNAYGWYDGKLWWNYSTTQVLVTAAYTEYQYRDKIFTYYYYRFLAWSAWQDSVVTVTSNREVNSKIVYQYREK